MDKILSISEIKYDSDLNIYYVDCECESKNSEESYIKPFFFNSTEEAEKFISNINIKYDRNNFFS